MTRENLKSGCKGVSFSKRKQKWIAVIRSNGKSIHIGEYVHLRNAIAARKAAEAKYNTTRINASKKPVVNKFLSLLPRVRNKRVFYRG